MLQALLQISVVSDPYFFVVSTEVGDFAMRGDSGSLIVCPDSNLAIGVISAFESEQRVVRCVKLEFAYKIDYLLSAIDCSDE